MSWAACNSRRTASVGEPEPAATSNAGPSSATARARAAMHATRRLDEVSNPTGGSERSTSSCTPLASDDNRSSRRSRTGRLRSPTVRRSRATSPPSRLDRSTAGRTPSSQARRASGPSEVRRPSTATTMTAVRRRASRGTRGRRRRRRATTMVAEGTDRPSGPPGMARRRVGLAPLALRMRVSLWRGARNGPNEGGASALRGTTCEHDDTEERAGGGGRWLPGARGASRTCLPTGRPVRWARR